MTDTSRFPFDFIGAGKTTLLDCLTGHRKRGLSGTIKISAANCSSASSSACNSFAFANKCHFVQHNLNRPNYHHHNLSSAAADANHHYRYAGKVTASDSSPPAYLTGKEESSLCCNNNRKYLNVGPAAAHQQAPVSGGDNLKVSIIPQNDHLMGHLTVYETLSYASKMKNCFDRQFNHKLNIKRVAQQLGLMSCLETRINKLSGGQYKRVSIAQELLSSPDILILDEPTSGLDAMTCYQTVQVLRKLTDDRQRSGQNQIAVILTIHQPNSDVFQQFNHVYVVAQGGKCIYEGPPASIESVINRVGIRLPNSYYNPATMIVEIAAGKFGFEAINKLNCIQKKQYDFVVPDEQNSTGDSAVDCPTSSNDEDDTDDQHPQCQASTDPNNPNKSHPETCEYETSFRRHSEINNNFAVQLQVSHTDGGLVNKGFVMENDDESIDNDHGDHCKNVVVVVASSANAEDTDSMDKIRKTTTGGESMQDTCEGRRKKRRRTRRRSGQQDQVCNNASQNNSNNTLPEMIPSKQDKSSVVCAGFVSDGSGGGGGGGGGSPREKRLKLNSLKADQKFPFWRHTYLHFHRSWLSIVRDPMLCSMQLALHIIVPVMVSLVYGTNVGKPNACPRAGPMDIMAYALEPTDSALQLQEDLRTTLENIGYIFFKLYGIIFAAMTVTVLTFPLDMHVLVKEFRNGWYGLSSYFLGRTLADIPFQLTLPLLAMSLSYYATGQPYSYMQWRFLSITGILILSSLIAQSQGLLFGAILMDRMKAAVFVAPAATTPIILFAGFLVRTQSIPHYLRPLSNLSYLRYAIEACLISRYGFNQCECDPAVFNQTVPELPPIARSMLDYWLSSFKTSASASADSSALAGNGTLDGVSSSNPLIETTTTSAGGENPDLFTKLIDSLAKANSFGRNITSCEQVVPYPMIDYDLKDSQLFNCFAILLFMLVFTRLLTFFIVCFKVKRKV